MRFIDISMTLSQHTPTYPKDPRVSVKTSSKDGCIVSRVSMGLHSGTHVDAPIHYIRGGKTLAELPLERLNGRAKVCDLTGVSDEICLKDLKQFSIRSSDIILLKTKNSRLHSQSRFVKEYVTLGAEAAFYLADKGVSAVGIDYLSVDKPGKDLAHRILLSHQVPIIEGLDLTLARNGSYRLICMPLKFTGTEAAPARCILVSG